MNMEGCKDVLSLVDDKETITDCNNTLWLAGDEAEIWRFVQLTILTDDLEFDLEHETVLAFKKLPPISDEDVGGSEKGILESVYANYDEASRCCRFTTENFAPINTILEISKQFPLLIFNLQYMHYEYNDKTLATCGIIKYHNGQILRISRNVVFVKTCPSCRQAEVCQYPDSDYRKKEMLEEKQKLEGKKG